MSKCLHCLASVTVLATLALTPIVARANDTRAQFVVSVNVINTCYVAIRNVTIHIPAVRQRMVTARDTVALSCSSNTGYDVSLGPSGKPASAIDSVSTSGVGNGATQIIPVYERVVTQRGNDHGVQIQYLVMTINY